MNNFSKITFSSLGLLLIGCNVTETENLLGTRSTEGGHKKEYIIDPNDPFLKYTEAEIIEMFSNTSCNSFGGGSSSTSGAVDFTRGLVGTMKSAPVGFESDLGSWAHLDRFLQPDVIDVPGQAFFDKLNVPTRIFSTGFPLLNGQLLQGPSGSPLIEFFRIDFRGMIEMSEGEYSEANYEFAAIGDDGIRMKINGQTIIDHPLVTPPKLMCGTQPVFMSPEEPLDFELAYAQAPRYHIALVLLWRKVGSGPTETACNQAGVSHWFDYTQPNSPPTTNYTQLISRGWQVVGQENFRVPVGIDNNPCSSSYVQSIFGI